MKVLEISSIDNTCGVSIFTKNKIKALAPLGIETQKCHYSQIPANTDFDLVVIEYEGGLISPQHLNTLAAYFQKKKIPVIVETHELIGNELFYADAVISHHNWKELMANPDMHYIPHPCQEISTVSQEQARDILHLPQDELIFVSPGRLELRKLFHENVEALKNYIYVMIGTYPMTYYYGHRRYLRECMKYDNHQLIVGTPVSEHVLTLYSQAADFLLFNNDITNYSISGSAMMSASLGKVGFMRNVKLFDMFNNSNSFKFNDITEIPDILKSTTNDEILSRELQLLEMQKQLSWPNVAHQYLILYNQILEKKK